MAKEAPSVALPEVADLRCAQPRVPPWSAAGRRVVVFDGVCNACSKWVDFALKRDRKGELYFAALQSPVGQQIAAHCGVSVARVSTRSDANSGEVDSGDVGAAAGTMIFIDRGEVWLRSSAVLQIIRYFRWPWPLFSLALWVPRVLRDWAYTVVARNRYKLFGRKEVCSIPRPEDAQRFL